MSSEFDIELSKHMRFYVSILFDLREPCVYDIEARSVIIKLCWLVLDA